MAKPIIAQIVDKMVTAIEAITVANGYQVTVNSVYRPLTLGGRKRTSPQSYDVQLVLDDEQPYEELDMMGNPPVIGLMQPVQLDLIYRPSDAATTPIDEVLDTFRSDVVRAIMSNPQWDGYAIDTTMGNPTRWADEVSGDCGLTETVSVFYRIKENDPFTLYYTAPTYTAVVNGGAADTADYTAVISGD